MKTVTIEELLTWAFVHELPKGGGVDGLDNVNSAWRMLQASSWGKVTAFAELMTMVDVDRGSGAYFEQGEPHDDALAVGQAVTDLALRDIVVPSGWNALADWEGDHPGYGDLVSSAVSKAVELFMLRSATRRRAHMVSLVVGTAVLGREPAWDAEPSHIRMIQRAGRPAWFIMKRKTDDLGQTYDIEVDGYNARSGRPARGAYRKYEFSTDPTGDILARLDWQLWVAALRVLEREVAPHMVSHRIVPTDKSMTPWLTRDVGGVRLEAIAARSKLF
ncbi:MAG TPA: hypothetical protein VGV39_15145 [Mesorhizobium sp.]|jgi:hypothetical protein|uniref:hypothetical protein n=1 Tax=Mesorhizobium sp. TaxID=1871066 RepID=UPI002DDD879A|nr:hypothetical protein [Mesorhizobium sp.]HEV2504413.1 hypothetical protein [Mesorhizobium sp.]